MSTTAKKLLREAAERAGKQLVIKTVSKKTGKKQVTLDQTWVRLLCIFFNIIEYAFFISKKNKNNMQCMHIKVFRFVVNSGLDQNTSKTLNNIHVPLGWLWRNITWILWILKLGKLCGWVMACRDLTPSDLVQLHRMSLSSFVMTQSSWNLPRHLECRPASKLLEKLLKNSPTLNSNGPNWVNA